MSLADLSKKWRGEKKAAHWTDGYTIGRSDARCLCADELDTELVKLRELREELYDGEVLTRSESSDFSTPEDSYSEGWQAAEKDMRDKLTARIGDAPAAQKGKP